MSKIEYLLIGILIGLLSSAAIHYNILKQNYWLPKDSWKCYGRLLPANVCLAYRQITEINP